MSKLIEKLQELDGYWKHKPGQKYIAELASGKLSDTFLNTGVITTNPVALKEAVGSLLGELQDKASLSSLTHVVGPAFGGIALAYEVARWKDVKALFTEPNHEVEEFNYVAHGEPHGGYKVVKDGQKFRFDLPENSNLLFVEDVITTGKSTMDMIHCVAGTAKLDNLIEQKTGWLPFVMCLVNRSGETHLSGFEIISLADVKARTWDSLADAQKDLPEVMGALKPKSNWKELTNG